MFPKIYSPPQNIVKPHDPILSCTHIWKTISNPSAGGANRDAEKTPKYTCLNWILAHASHPKPAIDQLWPWERTRVSYFSSTKRQNLHQALKLWSKLWLNWNILSPLQIHAIWHKYVYKYQLSWFNFDQYHQNATVFNHYKIFHSSWTTKKPPTLSLPPLTSVFKIVITENHFSSQNASTALKSHHPFNVIHLLAAPIVIYSFCNKLVQMEIGAKSEICVVNIQCNGTVLGFRNQNNSLRLFSSENISRRHTVFSLLGPYHKLKCPFAKSRQKPDIMNCLPSPACLPLLGGQWSISPQV